MDKILLTSCECSEVKRGAKGDHRGWDEAVEAKRGLGGQMRPWRPG